MVLALGAVMAPAASARTPPASVLHRKIPYDSAKHFEPVALSIPSSTFNRSAS